jgi:16S rRNA (cytosine967-C5)-methyltransferase
MSRPDPRRIAAQVLGRVQQEGAWSNLALDQALSRHPEMDPRDRALATELVYGALTWRRRLDEVLAPWLRGRVDPEVRVLLHVALYQILFLDRVPDHAAVHEAVQGAHALRRGPGAPRFVNGVLRTMLRERAKWPQGAGLGGRWSLPEWLAARMEAQQGAEEAERLGEALAGRPGLHLRVTASERARWVEALGGEALRWSPSGVEAPGMTAAVAEALASGAAQVQDEAAQLVGWLAAPGPGQRVLDGCAGLGGKALHLAEQIGPQGALVALEPHEGKLGALREAFARRELGLAGVHRGDLREVSAAALGGAFDVVLVDAPCTGLGVLRRHPEARWSRQPEDVAALARLQGELLEAASGLVKAGGVLVYSVCTWTPEEGPAQVSGFLARRAGWSLEAAPAGAGVEWSALEAEAPGAYRAWPHRHGCDGFYLARLRAP